MWLSFLLLLDFFFRSLLQYFILKVSEIEFIGHLTWLLFNFLLFMFLFSNDLLCLLSGILRLLKLLSVTFLWLIWKQWHIKLSLGHIEFVGYYMFNCTNQRWFNYHWLLFVFVLKQSI
jgi:hypothetical protein